MTLSKINAAINGAIHKPSLDKGARLSQVMHGKGRSLSSNLVSR